MYDLPSNTVALTGFGTARLTGSSQTRAGIVLGPSARPTALLDGGNVNGHTDLFAPRGSLCQLLTGNRPSGETR